MKLKGECYTGKMTILKLMGDWATGEEGSLSGYTAEIDPSTGEVKYFKDIASLTQKKL
jgi:hypothetical protein